MLQIYCRQIVSSTLKFSNAHSFNLKKDLGLSRIAVQCLHTSSNPENRIVQGGTSIAQRCQTALEKRIHGASCFSTSPRAFRKEHKCPPKCKEKIEIKPNKCLAVKCVATPHYSEISQVKPPDLCEKKPEELCLPEPCCPEYPLCVIEEKPPDLPKIVIVGSGVAGLSAAQMLAKAGLTNYVVIEGSSRPGGRISSRWFGDTVIELGPEGERANTWHQPVVQFAIEEGFLQQPLAKSDPSFGLLSGDSTNLASSCYTYGKFKTIMKDAFSIWPNAKRKDRSMILSVIGLRMKQALRKMPLEIQTPTVKVMYGLLCSFFCSYQDCSSFIKNNDFGAFITLPGCGISIPLGTLGALSPLLSAVPNEKIHFNKHVRSIRYGTVTSTQKPRALVSTMDGSVYNADYVVVTSSLGTIKSQASSMFSPLLPATKVNAVDSIEYVHMDKIFLYFEKPLWTWRSCYINKSWSPEEMRSRPNWTKGITKVEELPNSKHILCVWLEGPEVVNFERQPEEEVLSTLSQFLCDVLNDPKTPTPSKMVRSMWSTNSLFMGAYSRSSPSSTSVDKKMLAAFESPLPSISDPLPPIVFFGGEGTSIGYSATVAGARSSGIREVSKIIQLTPPPTKSTYCEDQSAICDLSCLSNIFTTTDDVLYKKLKLLEQENQQLVKNISDLKTISAIDSTNDEVRRISPTESGPGLRKLQDEINVLTKRNCELENQLRGLDQNVVDGKSDQNVDATQKVKDLEKTIRMLRQEKEEASKDKVDMIEKLKMQDKELKDALSQRKLAMSEYSEVSDKLQELRVQKTKLSRQVRDKEEELEVAMQKVDSLRQDLRRAEKLRRELEARVEDAIAETSKERKLRERSEEYCRQLELETERWRTQRKEVGIGSGESLTSSQSQLTAQEISRLKGEVERLDLQYKESSSQQQARFNLEINALKEQLHDAESARDMLQREVQIAKEKLDSSRLETLTDNEEALADMARRHDREKILLLEENKKLAMDLDDLSQSMSRLQAERRQLEDDYEELRNKKEAIAQWETQISEIIQWVNDEKDARGYLQALATKMTEELEFLKHSSGGNMNTPDKNWRNRRSQKLEKMELLNLQSSLQSEIQAKTAISEELTKTRTDLIASQKELRDFRQRYESINHELKRKDMQIKDLQNRLESGDGFLERDSPQMTYLGAFLKESGPGSVESDDADIEDNRAPSITSSKSNLSEMSLSGGHGLGPKPKSHQFLIRTFNSPTKCSHCTSLMVGLTRQGAVCDVCGFTCHSSCCHKVPPVCPVPPNQTKRPLGIDPTRGIGTAYEGYVKVPRTGGVKKGWVRQFVVVCDFKLFLYDISPDRNALPSVNVSQVLDMRDDHFLVSSVGDSDVIHATKKDIPCIFRISTSLMDPPGLKNHMLMLADTESEKNKWVVALTELHRILKRNNLPKTNVFHAKEILDNTQAFIKNTATATIFDPDRLVIGTEEGLFCLDLDRNEVARIGEGKRVYQVEVLNEEQVVIVIAGRQKQVRLVPVRALDGHEVEWIKVPETKGCITFCTGVMCHAPQPIYCLCVAIKRQNVSQVIIYEITRTKSRHKRLREVMLPTQAQCMFIFADGRLCVGYQAGFSVYSILGDHHPISLIHADNPLLGFLAYSGVDALLAAELMHGEYLLAFHTLAIYVDGQGRKSRETEIMYPASPTAITFLDGHLLVYSETHIDVFNASTSNWIQTLNVKKAKPLNSTGSLSICTINEMTHIIHIANLHQRDLVNIMMYDSNGRLVCKPRRRFSIREGFRNSRGPDRRSKMISAPTNFNHISHMGPGDGIQIQRLLDLPTTVETADLRMSKPTPPKVAPRPSHPPPHNGMSVRRRPCVTPPALPRTPDDLLHHEMSKVDGGSPRHSIASNNSSNPSTPPSPGRDHASSSYDS